MASGSDLYHCSDPKKWQRVSAVYWEVVTAKAAKQKRLLELEKWCREELPAAMAARPHRSLTLEELEKLMEWKLTRGKFRPRLKQLVSCNSAGAVERCSGESLPAAARRVRRHPGAVPAEGRRPGHGVR
ncbi:unnamed protein product [Ranitomeya imitator]|uniref:Uncharacterized protein n=1 Tax=Ranitomeya imitator TaxID=111125 RepID=A0ABN9LGN6_9NEOB|nr:unnamed protein product [Ranitomeya imitator]